ncbi:Subtilisin-like protein [Mycena venus]|uniref:Subtilisin-like protein n=1 Tax=Mycena venus TaxID=2733690 RepID=A0A8H7CFG8_9AGAR|nr:Subtilisin-like protein [Mycena venus]
MRGLKGTRSAPSSSDLPLPMALTQLLLFAFATVVAAAPRSVPAGWSLHRRADPEALIPLKFSLAQSNVDKLEAFLLDIADPQSPKYGQHWSPVRVKETFRPSSETVNTVHAWLTHEGVQADKIQLSPNGDILHLDVTIADAERLLQADYYEYSDEDGSMHVGCHDGYTLPEHVSMHVDFVWPTVHFDAPRSLSRRSASTSPPLWGRDGAGKTPIDNLAAIAAADCDTSVTLDCLRALYNFDFTPVSGDVNTVGVVEFGKNIYRAEELDLFFGTYRPDQVGNIPTLISVEGGDPDAGGSEDEASLDIELMMGLLGPKQNLSLYQVAQQNSSMDPTDRLLAALDGSYCSIAPATDEGITDCGNKPRTNVISISYHLNPDLNDPAISPVVQRQCTEFGKQSLTGITFVASSGDGGVAYGASQACLVNGTLTFGGAKGTFVGQLPASCPFVTAVGATSVPPGGTTDQVEESTTDFPSGGGFSNNFPRPSWQDSAVQNYLDNFAPDYNATIFNRTGRAYPDVATNGYPIVVAEKGRFLHTSGTSASAPIFAVLIAAVNDARIAAGKSPVGFINPALYSDAFAHTFNDVIVGSNPACQTDGFPAAPGWDPVSGMGTPNFEKLRDAFLALPGMLSTSLHALSGQAAKRFAAAAG